MESQALLLQLQVRLGELSWRMGWTAGDTPEGRACGEAPGGQCWRGANGGGAPLGLESGWEARQRDHQDKVLSDRQGSALGSGDQRWGRPPLQEQASSRHHMCYGETLRAGSRAVAKPPFSSPCPCCSGHWGSMDTTGLCGLGS
jgi:hypothetical protein